MSEKEISQAVIIRLPRYFRYLGELIDEGYERISSKELSERMRITASQVRQDLNLFGGFGQQGYGYNVKELHKEIDLIQGCISRMANNSVLLNGWLVSLITFIVVLSPTPPVECLSTTLPKLLKSSFSPLFNI